MSEQSSIGIVFGQPSFLLETPSVSLAVTQQGGHLAPVEFKGAGADQPVVQPYAIAPWWNEVVPDDLPPILKVLRGDFFCLPFGGNETVFQGEPHPVHGEVANNEWKEPETVRGSRGTVLKLSMETHARPGRVRKSVALVEEQEVVYCQHRVEGMEGPMCFGHHPCLKFPDEPGSGLLAFSPFVYGQVFPEPVETAETQGRSILSPGAVFSSLDQVPMVNGNLTDLGRYPDRRGYEDIAMIVTDPSLSLGWTAVSFPTEGYVWFALKDPKVLAGTVFWISNGGRDSAPWNGRHFSVMGLEDVTSYFHPGLAESVGPNPFRDQGFQTFVELDKDKPLIVNYIMGIARTPQGFGRVREVQAEEGQIQLIDQSGLRVKASVDAGFLKSGDVGKLIGA